jgi:hypothetical protein
MESLSVGMKLWEISALLPTFQISFIVRDLPGGSFVGHFQKLAQGLRNGKGQEI